MGEQIELMGGNAESGPSCRSLYPYFFSPREELGIANRLFNLR